MAVVIFKGTLRVAMLSKGWRFKRLRFHYLRSSPMMIKFVLLRNLENNYEWRNFIWGRDNELSWLEGLIINQSINI